MKTEGLVTKGVHRQTISKLSEFYNFPCYFQFKPVIAVIFCIICLPIMTTSSYVVSFSALIKSYIKLGQK